MKLQIYQKFNEFYFLPRNEFLKPHEPSRPPSKAPEGEGCPRCGGYVYAAEQMLARGRVSFKRNFSRTFHEN